MKNIYYFFFILILLFYSCKDDGINKLVSSDEDNAVNDWIENVMRNNYYWYKEIPSSKQLNFSATPDNFFISLLSNKDGKSTDKSSHRYYSYIENESSTRSVISSSNFSLGFEFNIYYTSQANVYALNILYVLPNSPASRSDLRRGEWIYSMNNQPITLDMIKSLNSQRNVKLGIGKTVYPVIDRTVTLSAEAILDNPVYVDTTYIYNGKKIAYLMYNHFSNGPEGNGTTDETYNNALRRAFSKFKKNSPDDFILDLRYNRGGMVTCAQLLATMLAPESALNNVFCNIQYNDKLSSRNRSYKLDPNIVFNGGVGENINLKRLFIITSKQTASASEAVINGLKPYFGNNIILVGEKTEGKNVGSLEYSDKRFNWVLHPIVCLVSNKDSFSDYSNGFSADHYTFEPTIFLKELGDTEEFLLNQVLNYITKGTPISVLRNSSPDLNNCILKGSSLDRKSINGILLPNE